jgi:hypothetical protein
VILSRLIGRWLGLACVLMALAAAPSGGAQGSTLLYRIFLQDGTTLVSYGEFARVADRVVFSIPVGAPDGANLHLVSIPESLVDWGRTDDYTNAVRAAQFAATNGPNHFALLGSRVTEALNDIRITEDPARQLAMAEEARRNLARWPGENFHYRADDVAKMVDLFDEVISELRIAAGGTGFDLRFSARTSPPPAPALLLPPTEAESFSQAMTAARLAAEPAERTSLLQAIAAALRSTAGSGGWAASLYARVSADLAAETKIDRQYQDLVRRTIATASSRAARADVDGLESLTRATLQADDRLGRTRPHEIASLLAFLDARLEEARDIREARQIWDARRAQFEHYKRRTESSLEQLRRSIGWLTDLRDGRGGDVVLLDRQEQRTVMARRVFELVPPPAELSAVQSVYTAAFHMARRAASAYRTAVSLKDPKMALDASSAAAGALMLLGQADDELARLLESPNR